MKAIELTIAAVMIWPLGALAQDIGGAAAPDVASVAKPVAELVAPARKATPAPHARGIEAVKPRETGAKARVKIAAAAAVPDAATDAAILAAIADPEANTVGTEAEPDQTKDMAENMAENMAEATPDPAPAPDPAIAGCLDAAGPATAGVPAGANEAAARRVALRAAAEVCTEAAKVEGAPAEVLFLAAEIAQTRRDLATAFDLLERSAALGFGPAETRLGDYHLFGLAPGGEDVEKAIARFEAAAALGDPAGTTTLALMYRVGKGVPRDAARMVALLQQAADTGYHFANYRLAETYMTGEGIPGQRDAALGIPDPARAAALYTAAAEAGNLTAALDLAAFYANPASGLPDNPAEQARLTRIAARAGLPEATAALGLLYEIGRGVARDPAMAAQLYVEALESGKVAFEALRKGAQGGWNGETAVAFQQLLRARGLYAGALDGVIGPGSAAGARALAGN